MTEPNTSGVDPIAAVASLAEPTRRRLFEWLVGRTEPVGRDEAAAALGIGRPLVAFHLDRLVEAGLLDVDYRRLTGRSGPGAGRPAKLYRATRRELAVSVPARRYEVAAELFAESLEAEDGGDPPPSLVRAAARRGSALAERARKALPRRLSRRRARSAVVDVLAEGGYAPHEDPDGSIRLANCPYDALVADHRDLICGANVAMAAALVDGLGSGFEAHLAPAAGRCCVVLEPTPD